jgi:hypothetical protein
MRYFVRVMLCALSVSAASAYGQKDIAPVQVPAGTVVTFYSQTRLNPGAGNALDELPKGSVLKVRMLEAIDSNVDRDGREFRGVLAAPIMSGNAVVVHADAEVHGLLVLLRSRNHPEGFRYELLITTIHESGKSYELTASLNPSFVDPAASPIEHSPDPEAGSLKPPAANLAKTPATKN